MNISPEFEDVSGSSGDNYVPKDGTKGSNQEDDDLDDEEIFDNSDADETKGKKAKKKKGELRRSINELREVAGGNKRKGPPVTDKA